MCGKKSQLLFKQRQGNQIQVNRLLTKCGHILGSGVPKFRRIWNYVLATIVPRFFLTLSSSTCLVSSYEFIGILNSKHKPSFCV